MQYTGETLSVVSFKVLMGLRSPPPWRSCIIYIMPYPTLSSLEKVKNREVFHIFVRYDLFDREIWNLEYKYIISKILLICPLLRLCGKALLKQEISHQYLMNLTTLPPAAAAERGFLCFTLTATGWIPKYTVPSTTSGGIDFPW